MKRTAQRCLLLLAALLAWPCGAIADGDPASDVLLTESLFYSYEQAVSPRVRAALEQTIARAHAAKMPVRVALIESASDLGADPGLFGKPQRYASFLEQEIIYDTTPWLVVVMPQGVGVAGVAPLPPSSLEAPATPDADGMATDAITVIRALAARAGHPIKAPAELSSGGVGGLAAIGAGAAVVIALAAIGAVGARRRRSRR